MPHGCHSGCTLAFALLLSACAPTDSPADNQDNAGAGQGAFDRVCATLDGSTGEPLADGYLAQLEGEFQLHAQREEGAAGSIYHLVAEAEIEGRFRQLVCVRERYGNTQYDLQRAGAEGSVRLPGDSSGHARIRGRRMVSADDATVEGTIDYAGPLDTVWVDAVPERHEADDPFCIALVYQGPLTGSGQEVARQRGQQAVHPLGPEYFVGQPTVIWAREVDGGVQIENYGFTLCTAEAEPDSNVVPGLQRGKDGRSWSRSGQWTGHPAGKVERRTVDFKLRLVPPTLEPRGEAGDPEA